MSKLLVAMAGKANLDPVEYENTLRKTIVPGNCTPEQFTTFLMVASEYDLNPITKQVYAFPAKGGGIQPIVSIDGWIKIINSHKDYDGMEFTDNLDDKSEIISITCRIFRKDRKHPIEVTEYLKECFKPTDPWKKWPGRMLRHKATIQAARYAFGLSGIVDQDEAERMSEPETVTVDEVFISDKAVEKINGLMIELKVDKPKFLTYMSTQAGVEIKEIDQLPASFEAIAITSLEKKRKS